MKIPITIPAYTLSEIDKLILEGSKGTENEAIITRLYQEKLKFTEERIINLPCDDCGTDDWNYNTEGEIFKLQCACCGALR